MGVQRKGRQIVLAVASIVELSLNQTFLFHDQPFTLSSKYFPFKSYLAQHNLMDDKIFRAPRGAVSSKQSVCNIKSICNLFAQKDMNVSTETD